MFRFGVAGKKWMALNVNVWIHPRTNLYRIADSMSLEVYTHLGLCRDHGAERVSDTDRLVLVSAQESISAGRFRMASCQFRSIRVHLGYDA